MAELVTAVAGIQLEPDAQGAAVSVAGSLDFRNAAGLLTVEALRGRSLVAKDVGFGRSGKSDPYVQMWLDGTKLATSKTVQRDLNPTWNCAGMIRVKQHSEKVLLFKIFDSDKMSSDDPMGQVVVDVCSLFNATTIGTRVCRWFDVVPCEGCKKVSGALEIAVTFDPKSTVKLAQGQKFDIDANKVATHAQIIGVGWTGAFGAKVDLDASCVFFDSAGKVADALYFGKTNCFNGAAVHSGDARTGEEALDVTAADEIITLKLGKLPRSVASALLIVTAYRDKTNFNCMSTAFCGLWDPDEGEMCRYAINCKGGHTGLVMCRLSRGPTGNAWVLSSIGDVAVGPRDWGSWVPELKHYLEDIVPGIVVGDAVDRTAIMHKGNQIEIANYCAGPLSNVAMGLAWDITQGKSIDLDASAILFDSSRRAIEIIYFGNLKSRDGTVRHSGDDRSGDGGGDDEIIQVDLTRLHHSVAHVAFVVCSFSGQLFSNVANCGCHLFVPTQPPQDIALFKLSSTQFACTALLMSVLSKTDQQGWTMKAAGEGCTGKVPMDCIDEAQEYISTGALTRRW